MAPRAAPEDGRLRRSLRQRYWLRRAATNRRAGDDLRAFAYAARAAVSGDREGQVAVALGYLHGKGVPPSPQEAARWFQQAGAAGDVDAMVHLAKLALQGLAASRAGTGPDFATGQLWAGKAASAGSIEGKLLLANVSLFGPPAWRDAAAASRLFRDVAEAGNASGALGLAIAMLKGQPGPAEWTEIYGLIQMAARQALPLGLYLAGAMLEVGLGSQPDPARAVDHYRRAALAGLRPAQTRFGYALLHGLGIVRDAQVGETWLRKAALAGDPAAAAIVGAIYLQGGDLPPHHAEAANWLTRAADLGHAPAASALAALYREGSGFLRDDAEAAAWSRRAAELGPFTMSDDPAALLPGHRVYPDAAFAAMWRQDRAKAATLSRRTLQAVEAGAVSAL